MALQADNEYARRLGAQIRSRRMSRGMSLRALAKELNLSGHAGLVDYELGRRIPPANLVDACERVFQVSDGALRNLREKALAERASQVVDQVLRTPEPLPRVSTMEPASGPAAGRAPGPDTEAAVSGQPDGASPGELSGSTAETISDPAPRPDPPSRPRPRRRGVFAGVLVLLVVGLGIGAWQWESSGITSSAMTTTATPRFGFEDGAERWSALWGNDDLQYAPTPVTSYEGKQSLQITAIKASNTHDKAIGTTHGLGTLHPGMKVTFSLQTPGHQPASVRFFVYDSHSTPHYAPETPGPGNEIPLPAGPGWQQYVWTVPQVDTVHAIGMEIYQDTDAPVTIWLDAVRW